MKNVATIDIPLPKLRRCCSHFKTVCYCDARCCMSLMRFRDVLTVVWTVAYPDGDTICYLTGVYTIQDSRCTLQAHVLDITSLACRCAWCVMVQRWQTMLLLNLVPFLSPRTRLRSNWPCQLWRWASMLHKRSLCLSFHWQSTEHIDIATK